MEEESGRKENRKSESRRVEKIKGKRVIVIMGNGGIKYDSLRPTQHNHCSLPRRIDVRLLRGTYGLGVTM